MRILIDYRLVDSVGNVIAHDGVDGNADTPRGVEKALACVGSMVRGHAKRIVDGSATAAGMNRMLDGNAKDTVKYE